MIEELSTNIQNIIHTDTPNGEKTPRYMYTINDSIHLNFCVYDRLCPKLNIIAVQVSYLILVTVFDIIWYNNIAY